MPHAMHFNQVVSEFTEFIVPKNNQSLPLKHWLTIEWVYNNGKSIVCTILGHNKWPFGLLCHSLNSDIGEFHTNTFQSSTIKSKKIQKSKRNNSKGKEISRRLTFKLIFGLKAMIFLGFLENKDILIKIHKSDFYHFITNDFENIEDIIHDSLFKHKL